MLHQAQEQEQKEPEEREAQHGDTFMEEDGAAAATGC